MEVTNARLVKVSNEPRARGHLYVVTDRGGAYALISQSLSKIARAMTRLGLDALDRVSVPTLYEAAQKGYYAKRQWRVQRVPLDQVDVVNDAMVGRQTIIVGNPRRYTLKF